VTGYRSLAVALARAGVVIVIISAGDARAQDCAALTGPARTDCFIVRARILGHQSTIAAGAARRSADAAFLRAATGTSPAPKPRRARPKHRLAIGRGN